MRINGMYHSFLDILKVLRGDEELNRILYYPPEDLSKGVPDPLDSSLPNIMDMPPIDRDKIRNERIMKSLKNDDLIDKQLCRIYVYAGRRIPERNQNNSYLTAEQQIKIDILVHNDIENLEPRMERIMDRLDELLCLKYVTGLGKMDYVDGSPINAPKDYVGYQAIYNFTGTKR